jgi:hypothetical protein
MLRPLFTPGRDPVPIVQEAGWAPVPVLTGAENLASTGIWSPDRPARSQSLYRLSYPAHSCHVDWSKPCVSCITWRSNIEKEGKSDKVVCAKLSHSSSHPYSMLNMAVGVAWKGLRICAAALGGRDEAGTKWIFYIKKNAFYELGWF